MFVVTCGVVNSTVDEGDAVVARERISVDHLEVRKRKRQDKSEDARSGLSPAGGHASRSIREAAL
jgi:hypothetical protein